MVKAQTTCPKADTGSLPNAIPNRCMSPKPTDEKMIDLRSEYLLRKTVRTMPLNAISSKRDGMERRRLGEAGGRSLEGSKTYWIKLQFIGCPSKSRYTNDAATCDSARMT